MKKERLTKRLALFTALTLTGAMLAGCGNTDAAESSSDAQTELPQIHRQPQAMHPQMWYTAP